MGVVIFFTTIRFSNWYKAMLCAMQLFVCQLCFGQDPPFINYSEQNGLSTSVVYGLFQDSEDNIWFCTNSGAVKFNGNKLISYKKKDGLSGNEVFKIFEDSQHRLWFMTASGRISYYKDKKIYNEKDHPVFDKLGISSFISDIREDKDHQIWIVPDRGNIYALSPNLQSFREISFKTNNGIFFGYEGAGYLSATQGIYLLGQQPGKIDFLNFSASKLNARHWFSDNVVYTARNKRVEMYDMQRKSVSFFETPDLPLSLNAVSIIDSFIYLCSANGLSLYNKRDHKKAGQYFSNVNVSHVLKDKEGSLWISTLNDGVMYIPNMQVRFLKSTGYFQGNKVLKLNGLGNHVIIGQSNSQTHYYYRGALQHIRVPYVPKGEGRTYTIVAKRPDSSFIISNQSGLTEFFLNGKIKYQENMALLAYAGFNDSIYLGTPSVLGKFPRQIEPRNFLPVYNPYVFDSIRADVLYFDESDSVLYAGTKTGMLLYKNKKKIKNRYKEFAGLSFTDIDKTGGQILIATTLGDGVFFFNRDTLLQLNEKNGLTDNLCSSLFIENDSTVWVTTLNGLNRIVFNYQAGSFNVKVKNLYRHDGLPSNYINDIYVYGDTIWLATNTGLAVFNKKNLPDYSYTPKMAIESFKANDVYKPVFSSARINLDRNSNNIVIEFNCRTFKSSVSVLYKYKLVGLNSNWVETRNNQVDFTGLPPGNYEFAVYAYSLNENWKSNIERIYFTIKPAYWETNWFRILLAGVVLLIVSLFIFYRFRKVKKDFALQKRIINYEKEMLELEQQALRLQMNPHFIFNALNSIQHAILTGKQNDAYNSLELFSSLIRGILENSKHKFISLEDEIEILKIYIQIEAKRFSSDFNYDVKIDPEIDISSIKIPPMLIQPFVENSIWHGLMPKTAGEKKLILSFDSNEDSIICKVEDNGIGRAKAAEMKSKKHGTSLGTALTFNRVANINMFENKNRYLIDIYDKPDDEGTIVTITIQR
ncbi:MAG: histidine kinase [Ferruginibacter sp.]|nr:histidine kinase [Ferruginibacter sp.]